MTDFAGSPPILILAGSDAWEDRFQVTSLAAAAAAAGQRVDVALFFAALDAWAGGRWDDAHPSPVVGAERLAAAALPPLSSLLAAGREAGAIRFYACSASMHLLALEPAQVQAAVDAIVGWSTFHRLMRGAERVVRF